MTDGDDDPAPGEGRETTTHGATPHASENDVGAAHAAVESAVDDSVELPPVEFDEGHDEESTAHESLADLIGTLDQVSGPRSVSSLPPVADMLDAPLSDPPPAFRSDPPEPQVVEPPPPPDPPQARARVKVRTLSGGNVREVRGPKFTGQRNEDSLLFDMSLVPTRPLRDLHPKLPESHGDEDSGLIDISRFAEAARAPVPARPPSPVLDELLSVGLGSPTAGGLLAPIEPPVLAKATPALVAAGPASGVNKTIVISVAICAFILTTGVSLVFVVLYGRTPEAARPGAETSVVVSAPPPSAPIAGGPIPHAPTAVPDPESPAPSAAGHRVPVAAVRSVASQPSPSPVAAPPLQRRGAPLAAPHRPAVSAAAPSPRVESAPAAPRASASNSDLPATPSRADVVQAMQSLGVIVQACGSGTDPAIVDMTFAASGRVTTATVRAPYAGTPTGSCVARAVRAARISPFSESTFRVTYPFHL